MKIVRADGWASQADRRDEANGMAGRVRETLCHSLDGLIPICRASLRASQLRVGGRAPTAGLTAASANGSARPTQLYVGSSLTDKADQPQSKSCQQLSSRPRGGNAHAPRQATRGDRVMSPTIAECLEHARQCEWYAARTNDEGDRKYLLWRAQLWTKLAQEKEIELGASAGTAA
jgi:hypothetical protein